MRPSIPLLFILPVLIASRASGACPGDPGCPEAVATPVAPVGNSAGMISDSADFETVIVPQVTATGEPSRGPVVPLTPARRPRFRSERGFREESSEPGRQAGEQIPVQRSASEKGRRAPMRSVG